MKIYLTLIIILFIISCKPDEPPKPVENKPGKYIARFYAYTFQLKTIELSIQNDTQKIFVKHNFKTERNSWDTTIILKPGAKGHFLAKDQVSLNATRYLVSGNDTLKKFGDNNHTFELPK